MVEGLTCFRVDIRQKKKVHGLSVQAVDFLFYEVFIVVTYPPDPLPLGIGEGKGVKFREGFHPSQRLTPM